ncbi:MAG: VWA domain-containing protein, partial [Kofleriaceae bacterium]
MLSKIATTVTVFALAGAATVGAALLAQSRTTHGKVFDEPALSMCGTAGPTKVTAKLMHGTFAGALSTSAVLKGSGELSAQLQIATDEVGGPRPALDLAFVIDHSGSMSGRIEHAANAASAIVERLGPQDHASLIQYDDTADVMVQSIAMDAAGKAKMHAAIERLAPAGGTNLEGGLVAGRAEVERAHHDGDVNRVILLSDGRANVGVTDPGAIANTAREAADHGVRITAI